MNAETIARALGGQRSGSNWMVSCLTHEDRTPSLALRDAPNGTLLLHCFAGCEPADIFKALRERGLLPGSAATRVRQRVNSTVSPIRNEDNKKRTADALRILCEVRPAEGTLVETYLASRGIRIRPSNRLKFHPGLKHRSGISAPAMVALVTDGIDDRPIGAHRTWLAPDGLGKAQFKPNKMMLGQCRGGAVRLAPASSVLMIAEGIETALSAMQATGYPAWAALSTSGLKSLQLPFGVLDVIALADGDAPGEAAARAAALRWKNEGRRVRIAACPQGLDFNDLVRGIPSQGSGV